jgi:hypothetical protein
MALRRIDIVLPGERREIVERIVGEQALLDRWEKPLAGGRLEISRLMQVEDTEALVALLLFASNFISLNPAGVATFLMQGIRPATWWERARARQASRQALIGWLALPAMTALLIVWGKKLD